MPPSLEGPLHRIWNWLTFAGQRLQWLMEHGYTIDVAEVMVGPEQRILEINLGYGREYWLASAEMFRPNKKYRYIEDGRLILQGDRPLASAVPLRERGLSPERSSIRFR